MARQRVEHQPPDVLAMVPAETVLQDQVSGRYWIQGTYTTIQAEDFPWLEPTIAVYLAMTNGHARTQIRLQLVDVDESGDPLFERSEMVEFGDPLELIELVLGAEDVTFLEPGEYRLQLLSANELLCERRLQVNGPSGGDYGED